mmetsp:Transcript_22636/g.52810  ORF Transcript_22636/g.52810 Transcript_22636/m.52810 type:complete len:262 (-) Transcript_22636:41-826(-)
MPGGSNLWVTGFSTGSGTNAVSHSKLAAWKLYCRCGATAEAVCRARLPLLRRWPRWCCCCQSPLCSTCLEPASECSCKESVDDNCVSAAGGSSLQSHHGSHTSSRFLHCNPAVSQAPPMQFSSQWKRRVPSPPAAPPKLAAAPERSFSAWDGAAPGACLHQHSCISIFPKHFAGSQMRYWPPQVVTSQLMQEKCAGLNCTSILLRHWAWIPPSDSAQAERKSSVTARTNERRSMSSSPQQPMPPLTHYASLSIILRPSGRL